MPQIRSRRKRSGGTCSGRASDSIPSNRPRPPTPANSLGPGRRMGWNDGLGAGREGCPWLADKCRDRESSHHTNEKLAGGFFFEAGFGDLRAVRAILRRAV